MKRETIMPVRKKCLSFKKTRVRKVVVIMPNGSTRQLSPVIMKFGKLIAKKLQRELETGQ